MYHPKVIEASRKKLEENLGFELRDYSLTEVEDFAYELKNVDWSQGVEKGIQNLPDPTQRYIISEIHHSQIDFRYWAARYAFILSDEKRHIRFDGFWPGQEKLLSLLAEEEIAQTEKGLRPKIRIALLKSRQVGGTVISEALASHMTFLWPKTQSIVGSDHPDNTLKLWQTLLRIYDNLPGWMKPLPDAKPKATNLHFPDLDSDIVYGSGNQRTTLGQGMTVDFAHLTEVSTWLYPHYLDEDLFPAFESSQKHHTLLILESTGAGAQGNWFHDKFMAAWSRENEFRSIFVGWFMRPSWRMDSTGIELDPDTLKHAKMIKEQHNVELDKEQMAWWQVKKKSYVAENKLEIFYQEYPSIIEEAFQTGFRAAVPLEIRMNLRRKAKKPNEVYEFDLPTKKMRKIDLESWWAKDSFLKWEQKLLIWERKKPGYMYVIGVDASHGIDGGDNAAIEVLRIGNRYRPDEQVAEFCGNISPLELADVSAVVGQMYNDGGYPGKLAIEVNPGSPGIVTQTELLRRNYPNFYRWRRPLRMDGKTSVEVGWWTTPGTRPLLTERGVEAIIKETLWINSLRFVDEVDTFVNTGLDRERGINRKFLEAAPGYHDDRIMSLFIALEVAHADDLVNVAEERRKTLEQMKAPKAEAKQFNMDMHKSWDQLMEEWENAVVDSW